MGIRDVGVRIRPATEADFHIIRELEEKIFPEDPWTDGMIKEELASPARAYFIAENLLLHDFDGTVGERENVAIIGYAGVSLGVDADVMTVGVMRNARKVGVGGQLVAAMMNAARVAGAERIFLEVRASNKAAQKLYEKHGFDRIGTVQRYFRNPTEDAVTMRHIVLSESNVS